MLVELSVQDIGIFESAQMTFGGGLTAITGETGAGKSLLVGAISLALGDRADAGVIRSGRTRASVRAAFLVNERTAAALSEVGIECEEGAIYVQRDLAAEGKSQCRINGQLVPLSTLKSVGDLLADLHGQHEHQTILNPSTHCGLLDAYIGKEAETLRSNVQSVFEKWTAAKSRLKESAAGDADRAASIDLLKFQIQEIEAASPREGEYAILEQDVKRLRSASRLRELLTEANGLLIGGDLNALSAAASASKLIEQASQFDASLKAALESSLEARYALEAAAASLRGALENLDSDEHALDRAEARISQLQALRRKYGADEQAVLRFLETAKSKLNALTTLESDREALTAQVEKDGAELRELCSELSKLRADAKHQFASLILNELRDLGMGTAHLEISMQEKDVSADGADKIELMFSANEGEPPKPLSKIASGGELSRFALAAKTVLAGKEGGGVMIFDEVDAGIGGETAITLGAKLAALS